MTRKSNALYSNDIDAVFDCTINAEHGIIKLPRQIRPLAVSIADFCRLTSLSRTSTYQLIREGKVEVTRIGRRTLILMRSVEALMTPAKAGGVR